MSTTVTTTMTTTMRMSVAHFVPARSFQQTYVECAAALASSCCPLKKRRGSEQFTRSPMANADPLGLASDPSNVTLGEVDLDEMLNLRKQFPADELQKDGFTTYGEVHNLLHDNPMFTDPSMIELMNKVEQGMS